MNLIRCKNKNKKLATDQRTLRKILISNIEILNKFEIKISKLRKVLNIRILKIRYCFEFRI
ncbi:hypothetical protein AUJ40_02890 [Candidatus Berkelbacteria bacterium CG1_02_42_45]|uniref:Uncharacterized protein n=1 Tax=Candidatus Berkelbacteria bacterium CG1_02_42_45 TaxID=1805036 RepID=A0A1J4RPC1_9BACT|nr:MAG: hypothetical protein AUJ40_02890 [Candidatus Berkelbacteria bacterium CG1_02_42_45]